MKINFMEQIQHYEHYGTVYSENNVKNKKIYIQFTFILKSNKNK